MVIDLSGGCVIFKFSPQDRLPLAMLVSAGPCLQVQMPDLSLSRCHVGHLSREQCAQIQEVIVRYPDVLTSRLGLTRLLQYEIILKDTRPVKLPPYRLAPPKMKFLREQIKKLLDEGVIELSASTYSSPMFLVPKVPNNFRAVVDYRLLNQRIEVESTPLPDIHSAFNWFAKAKYFSTFDLNQASTRFRWLNLRGT
jgi:hypothetical protein